MSSINYQGYTARIEFSEERWRFLGQGAGFAEQYQYHF